MAGAADGIAAVENRTLAGKIIVYPMLHETGLIPLTQLKDHFPTVGDQAGKWPVVPGGRAGIAARDRESEGLGWARELT